MIKQFFYLIILCCMTLSNAFAITYVKSITINPNKNNIMILFTLSQKTFGRVLYQPNNKKLQIIFAETTSNTLLNTNVPNNALIDHIYVTTKQNNLLVNILLQQAITWRIRFLPYVESTELQLILQPSAKKITVKKMAAKKVASASLPLSSIISTSANETNFIKKPHVFTVVIDAGHGGKDSGACGKEGTQEKQVVLAIAKKLARIINQSPNMRAQLTRSGDYFVPLRKRLKLARKDNADLFIAIHADAFFDTRANGASIYVLSQKAASSEAARWLAQQDNYVELDDIALQRLQDQSVMLRSMLIDLAQTATIQDSLRLGNTMLRTLRTVTKLRVKQVEQAPFVVLKSPDIPSVLVETGFISNPIEEKKLINPLYQATIARALAEGVQIYATNERLNKRLAYSQRLALDGLFVQKI